MRPRPLDRRQRYCPECQGLDSGKSALCPNCGGEWADSGYCSTCERYWSLPEGEECPKHALPLEPGPEPDGPPAWADGQSIDWVTVESYPHPIAAQAARLRLDAEGIPTFLDGARMGDNALYQNATGGVKLQVPRSLQSDARILLSQSWDVPTADDEAEDEEWDEPIHSVEVADDSGTRSLGRPMAMATLGVILAAIAWTAWSWLKSR